MALPVLRTARLVMVPFAESDIDTLHALWIDPDVRRYLWDDVVISRERAAEVVLDSIATAQTHGIGYWTLRTSVDGPVIGEGGLRFMDGPDALELMYCLARSHWGQGLAFEASQAALDYAWTHTKFDRVWARIDTPNEGSKRLARRLGFRYLSTAGPLDSFVIDRA